MKRTLASVMVVGCAVACSSGGEDNIFGNAGSTTGTGAGGPGSGGESSASGGSGQGGSSSTSSNVGPGGSGPGSGGMSTGGSGGSIAGGAGPGGMGQGGGGNPDNGCSDGTREYFKDVALQPNIAGCAGGFDVPGVTTAASMQPNCGRVSGNSSVNPQGTGCSVEDLCSDGWHVCTGAEDVSNKSASGDCEPAVAAVADFWLTRQVMDALQLCAGSPNTNNIVGCGSLGDPPGDSCNPLNRRMRYVECAPTAAWYCGNGVQHQLIEAEIVVKVSSEEGGVLCCKN